MPTTDEARPDRFPAPGSGAPSLDQGWALIRKEWETGHYKKPADAFRQVLRDGAYHSGAAAFRAGEEDSTNPWPKGTVEHATWCNGWCDAAHRAESRPGSGDAVREDPRKLLERILRTAEQDSLDIGDSRPIPDDARIDPILPSGNTPTLCTVGDIRTALSAADPAPDVGALQARVAELERLLDASWRKVISYRSPQVCKHFVAASMLSDMEASGFEVTRDLADAVVNCRDEEALAHAALSSRSAREIGGMAIPDELRRLSEAATPGEWVFGPDDWDDDDLLVSTRERLAESIVEIAKVRGGYDGQVGAEQKINATFIAAAVNFVRARLAESPAPRQSGATGEGED